MTGPFKGHPLNKINQVLREMLEFFFLFHSLISNNLIEIQGGSQKLKTTKTTLQIYLFSLSSILYSNRLTYMQDLGNILVKLSQKILNVNESRKLKLSKLMLSSLDPLFFTEGSLMSISTFSQLNFEIAAYYKDKFNEKIKDFFFYQIQLDDKFFAVYKLIMDLALNSSRKEEFLNAILDMTESQKNLLMDFVAEVVKRDHFIDFAIKQKSQKLAAAESTLINQKFHQLKEEYRQFEKIYYELLDAHESLKKNHQKIVAELTHLKQQKYELLDDLGLHHNAGFIDITEKYRKDVEDFAEDSARMMRELEQKTAQIKRKQKQNQQLILNFAAKQQQLSQTFQQKSAELLKRQNLVEKKLEESSEKQEEYRFQIMRLKDIIIDLRKQLEQKNATLFEQEGIIEKYNKMRKLHLQFRKVMVQNYRNAMTHLSPQGSGFASKTTTATGGVTSS